MAYLGKTPSQAVRQRYYFTASGGETSLSGADDNGNTLTFTDGAYVDVYLNGVLLVANTDYNTSTANTIGGLTALSASDVVEIVVYDTFAVFGGEVQGDLEITNGALKTTDITAVDANGIQFNTDEGTERVRIDDSGNLLVGTTDTDLNTNQGQKITGSQLWSTRTAGASTYLNRLSSDGEIVVFKKDGTNVGSIRAEDGDIVVGNDTSGLKFRDTDFIPRDMDGTTSNGVVTLGSSGSRFKDLYLSGGVYLGGTAATNLLDEYEEGTFTPEFGGTSSNPVVTYDSQVGYYVKIGKIVYVTITLGTDAVSGGSGDLVVKNLPFVNSSYSTGLYWTRCYGFASAPGTNVKIDINDNYMRFWDQNNITETTTAALGTGGNDNRTTITGTYSIS